MKRAILLTIAAGVATLPALWGVTGNTTFGQSVPAAIPSGASVAPSLDDRTSVPSATSTADDRGRDGKGSDDSATTGSVPTAAATSDDRRGRGSGDATTSSPTRAVTQVATTSGSRTTSSKATTAATVDDKGGSTQGADDSGGHGGKSGSGKG